MASNADYSMLVAAAGNAANIAADWNMSKKQNKRMIDFWNMQNAYNHPRAQMQRLQEAGLNPNLIYGDSVSGATGHADSVGTPSRPDKPDTLSGLMAFQNLKNMSAQEDLTHSLVSTEQAKQALMKAQAGKTREEWTNIMQGTDWFMPDPDGGKPTYSSLPPTEYQFNRLVYSRLQNEQIKYDILAKQIDFDVKDASKADAIKRIAFDAATAKATSKGRELNNELLKLQKQFLELGLDRNSPWYAKIFGAIINHFK